MTGVRRFAIAVVGAVLFGAASTAQSPAPPSAVAPGPDTVLLSETLRGLLLANLPDPIVTSQRGWGEQREVTTGVKWERRGKLLPRPEATRDLRNDGHWQRVTVSALVPDRTLALKVRNVRADGGKTLFDADLGLDVRMTYTQQVWAMGKRVYSGETRCRCHADVKLVAELTSRTEVAPGSVLPALTVRVRVTQADLSYKDLTFEHTLGIGGDAAKVLGKAAHGFITKAKPDLERNLLAQANAAIVRAADTKEVRVEFDKLLSGKPVTMGK